MTTLFKPQPLPDEIALGYFGRVMRMNGFHSMKHFVDHAARMFNLEDEPPSNRTELLLLSRIAEKSLDDFEYEHTCKPYKDGVGRWRGFSDSLLNITQRFELRLLRRGAYFCSACASADVQFHGISYWRREHQLPGHHWCQKHDSPLDWVETDLALQSPVTKYMNQRLSGQSSRMPNPKSDAFVSRYMEISSGILARRQQLDTANLRATFKRMAMQKGYSFGKEPLGSSTAMELIRKMVSDEWLSEALYDYQRAVQEQNHILIDGVFTDGGPVPSSVPYYIVAAALYDTADKALNAMTRSWTGRNVASISKEESFL
jgi:hypothetical protein